MLQNVDFIQYNRKPVKSLNQESDIKQFTFSNDPYGCYTWNRLERGLESNQLLLLQKSRQERTVAWTGVMAMEINGDKWM